MVSSWLTYYAFAHAFSLLSAIESACESPHHLWIVYHLVKAQTRGRQFYNVVVARSPSCASVLYDFFTLDVGTRCVRSQRLRLGLGCIIQRTFLICIKGRSLTHQLQVLYSFNWSLHNVMGNVVSQVLKGSLNMGFKARLL